MRYHNLLNKLNLIEETFNELTSRLSRSASSDEDLSELPKIAEAYCSLKETIDTYQDWKKATSELAEAQEIFNKSVKDLEMKEIAAIEIKRLEAKIAQLENQLEILLYLREGDNSKNVLLEIQALAGGEYSCFFAEDLLRMYRRYAEKQNWKVKLLSESCSDTGGIENAILEIKGDSVYGKLKLEAGIHEVENITNSFLGYQQKQPAFAMVKVMPEPEPSELEIKSEDINIKYYIRGFYRWELWEKNC